jgi:hypothetical protein
MLALDRAGHHLCPMAAIAFAVLDAPCYPYEFPDKSNP